MARRSGSVTIYDVAAKAGVSPATVSRVLNKAGYASDKVRKAVQGACDELGFTPDPIAEALRRKKTQVLGLVIPDISNPFWPDVCKGAEETLRSQGYQVILTNTEGELDREVEALELMRRRRVDGLLFGSLQAQAEHILPLLQDGIPVVILGQGIVHPNVDMAYTDNVKGGYLATEHLLKLGHRRIAFLGALEAQASAINRRTGYKAALESYGVEYDPGLIVLGSSPRWQPDEAVLKALMSVKNPPTAIFTMQDILAVRLWQSAESLGLKVPEDISIVGFDDIPMVGLFRSGLTTVRQPRWERGAAAASLLLTKLNGEREIDAPAERRLLEPELVVRSSTSAPH